MTQFLGTAVAILIIGPVLLIGSALFGLAVRKYLLKEEVIKKQFSFKTLIIGLPFTIILLVILALWEWLTE